MVSAGRISAGVADRTSGEGEVGGGLPAVDGGPSSQLDSFTTVSSDARFVSHLKKISRDIYDHLAKHLGIRTITLGY